MAQAALGAVRATLARYTVDVCLRMVELASGAGSAAQARAAVRQATSTLR